MRVFDRKERHVGESYVRYYSGCPGANIRGDFVELVSTMALASYSDQCSTPQFRPGAISLPGGDEWSYYKRHGKQTSVSLGSHLHRAADIK
jgi:hypothetical protein